MSEKKTTKTNWLVTVAIGITLGLALLIVIKNSLNPMNDRILIKIRSELKAIKYAVEKYKTHYGHYPVQSADKTFNFGEQLSPQIASAELKGSREMFIDYFEHAINVTNENYAAPNADPTTLMDPWQQPYYYISDGKGFTIWSCGVDQVNSNTAGDDISQISIFRETASEKSSNSQEGG